MLTLNPAAENPHRRDSCLTQPTTEAPHQTGIERRTADVKYLPQEEIITPPVFNTPWISANKPTGIKGRIISAYKAVLAIIEKISGVRMTPELTLREFLAMVTKLLPGITRHLTELTVLAERVLYSRHTPPGDTATAAERLTDNIQRELRRGA